MRCRSAPEFALVCVSQRSLHCSRSAGAREARARSPPTCARRWGRPVPSARAFWASVTGHRRRSARARLATCAWRSTDVLFSGRVVVKRLKHIREAALNCEWRHATATRSYSRAQRSAAARNIYHVSRCPKPVTGASERADSGVGTAPDDSRSLMVKCLDLVGAPPTP